MTPQTILDDMALLTEWEDKYGYLIDLGGEIPDFPEEARTAANKVQGCTSQVWMVQTWEEGVLHLQADSDAMIVKGLLAVVLAAYNGKTRAEIPTVPIDDIFEQLGLHQHLTSNRRNGFTAMVEKIRAFATA